MATTSIRTTAKAAVVTVLAAALPGKQVVYGWPGKDFERDCVYVLGPFEAAVTFPVEMAGRKMRDDIFVLTVEFFTDVEGGTIKEAEQRVEAMYVAAENVFAADQTLSNLDGVIDVLYGPDVLGPNSSYNQQGAQAVMTVPITIHSRLN